MHGEFASWKHRRMIYGLKQQRETLISVCTSPKLSPENDNWKGRHQGKTCTVLLGKSGWKWNESSGVTSLNGFSTIRRKKMSWFIKSVSIDMIITNVKLLHFITSSYLILLGFHFRTHLCLLLLKYLEWNSFHWKIEHHSQSQTRSQGPLYFLEVEKGPWERGRVTLSIFWCSWPSPPTKPRGSQPRSFWVFLLRRLP